MGEDARKSLSDNNVADATNGEEINDFVKMSYNEKREKIKENILKAIKEKEEGRQFVWTPTGLELMKKYYPDLYDRLSEEEKQGEVMSSEGEQLN
ncbi:hypothetical protein [Peptoniphilus mikwangii]|nr:hypothetical protein [Peptoniphilus mikwangii]